MSEVAAPRRRWWRFGTRTATALVIFVLCVESWAELSTEHDFYLPDLFRPFVLALLVLFLVTSLVPWAFVRRGLRTLALLVTGAVLLLEVSSRFRSPIVGADRVERVDDVLLRYRYQPGFHSEEKTRTGEALTVNHLGLLDMERAIPKPPGVFRVVVLTGSIANDSAVPYEDRFFRRLEADLAGAIPDGARVETINVSCEGYNSVQQVRALEKVGLLYEPDVVVLAYMLSSASLQNGAYRRFGNSFFLFRFLPLIKKKWTGSMCSIFAPFHDSYAFDLIVRNSFERLKLLGQLHHFRALVAVLPIVENDSNAECARLYDKVIGVAKDAGLETVRVADFFRGLTARDFAKPNAPWDVNHPNAEGHRRIGRAIADGVRHLMGWPAAVAPP